MEAAKAGTNIVVADMGTPRDYFGDTAFYCEPDDTESIYNAVMAAYYTPERPGLKENIQHRTWKRASRQVYSVYEQVLSDSPALSRSNYELPEWSAPKESQQIQNSLSEASAQATQASDAVSDVADAIRSNTTGTQAKVVLLCDEANELAKKKEFIEAISKFQEAICLDPECVDAYRGSAIVELQLGKIKEATQDFQEAIRLDPNDARSYAGLGSILWVQGDQEEAFKVYLEAHEKNPADVSIVLQVVNSAYVLDRLLDLEKVLLKYLQEAPKDSKMHYCLAGCFFKQEKYLQALHSLEACLEIDPENKDALELKPIVEEHIPAEDQDNIEHSVSYGRHLKDPVEVLIKDIEDAKEKKDHATVLDSVDEVIFHTSARPEQAELAKLLKAESLICVDELDKADEMLEDLELTSAHISRVLTARAVIRVARDEIEEAVRFFEKAIVEDNNCDNAIAGLGICAMKSNDAEKAWTYYTRALNMNPENIRALVGLVQLGYSLERLPEVEQALSVYIEMHPADLGMLYSLAGCQFRLNKLEESKENLQKILLFEPDNANAIELLGKIQEIQSSASQPER